MSSSLDARGALHRWRARRRRPIWWRAVIVVALLGLLIAAVGLIAHYRTPGSTSTLFVSAVSPYLVAGAVVALLLFAIARGVTGWIGLVLATLLIAGYVWVQYPLYTQAAAPAGSDVVVMTANLKLGMADPGAVVAAVRRHDVDVLMLEELTPELRSALDAAGLDRALPHSVADPREGAAGTGLWSRYPLTNAIVHHDFEFALVTATVGVPGLSTPPTAVALHMDGPYPKSAGWRRDIAHLPAVLQSLPTAAPTIVGGDFNATPDVAQFRHLLTGGYADGVAQAGAGILPTFPADQFYPPVIAIDHVLTRHAIARSAETVQIRRSDHRALVVSVRL